MRTIIRQTNENGFDLYIRAMTELKSVPNGKQYRVRFCHRGDRIAGATLMPPTLIKSP